MLGRSFQLMGLFVLPYALWRGFSSNDPKQELTLLGFGAVLFLIGVVFGRFGSSA